MIHTEHINLLREFLKLVGIPADVAPTEDRHCLITIPAEAYEEQRAYINAWFTPIALEEDYIVLTERMRGSGDSD